MERLPSTGDSARMIVAVLRERHCGLFLSIFFFLLSTIHSAHSQTDSAIFIDASPPFHETAGVSMVQDHDGFLWIIDSWRLLKYDGYTYKRFYNEHYRLFDSPVALKGISGGRRDLICLYSNVNKLLFLDTYQNETRVVSLKESGCQGNYEMSCVTEDSTGRFWIGSLEGNVFTVEPPDMQVVSLFECGEKDSLIQRASIRAITEDSQGNIWIGGDGGLVWLPGVATGFKADPSRADRMRGLPCDSIAGLLSGRDDRLWVCMRDGTIGWVNPVNRRFNKIADLPLSPVGLELTSFVEDCAGDLLIATYRDGLFRWRSSTDGWERHLVYHDGSGDRYAETIRGAMVDRSGILWVMTSSRGLLRHLPAPTIFNSYTPDEGRGPRLSGGDITSALMDRRGTLWIGRGSGGLDYLRPGRSKFGRLVNNPADPHSLSSNIVMCISERRIGEVWIGTIRGGISVFDYETKSFKRLMNKPGDPTSLGCDNVIVIYEDSRGTVWIGHVEGLDMYDPETKEFSSVLRWPVETIGNLGATSAIIEDRRGNLWVGTQNKGLLRMSLTTGDTVWYRPDPATEWSLQYTHVSALYVDEQDRLWVGTTLGLALFDYDTERFDNYDIALPRSSLAIGPGAPPPPVKQGVYGILGDLQGNIWVWLQQGAVARFDIQNRTFLRFGRADGVVATYPRGNAFFITAGGTIYCGGPGGVTWFHPENIPTDKDTFEAPVTISQFRVFQEWRPLPRSGSGPIVLAHSENTCSFEFSMLDYRSPEEYVYQYILEGLEPDWSLSSPERTVTYANLPSGQYQFRVRAANSSGVWSVDEAFVTIVVERPFWETWWFRVALVIAVVAIGYSLYRYRLSQLLALERLRLRIASDLHDEIGSNLGSIALQGQMVARLFRLPGDVQARLKEIVTLAQDTAQSTRDIVWLINPEHDRFNDLVLKMKETAAKMLEGMEYDFRAADEASGGSLDTETKRTTLLMYKEALNNILKHANARHVLIEMCTRDGLMVLKVQDDGVGFVEEHQSNGDGIVNMRRRAAALGGGVLILTKPNDGTTVEIQIPLSQGRSGRSFRRQIPATITRRLK